MKNEIILTLIVAAPTVAAVRSLKHPIYTATQYGRRWFAWTAIAAAILTLPQIFYRRDFQSAFLVWLFVLIIFGLFAFVLGSIWGRVVGRKRTAEQEGLSALMLAAADGRLEDVHEHIKQGVNPNELSQLGSTALMYAARNGHLDVVRALLLGGADPSIKTRSGSTALAIAKKSGHEDVVSVLSQ